MDLSSREQRVLDRISESGQSDPRLAWMLAAFGRLTVGEAMPDREQLGIPAGRIKAALHAAARLTAWAATCGPGKKGAHVKRIARTTRDPQPSRRLADRALPEGVAGKALCADGSLDPDEWFPVNSHKENTPRPGRPLDRGLYRLSGTRRVRPCAQAGTQCRTCFQHEPSEPGQVRHPGRCRGPRAAAFSGISHSGTPPRSTRQYPGPWCDSAAVIAPANCCLSRASATCACIVPRSPAMADASVTTRPWPAS
jgi:hypothetical protein